MTIRFEDDDGGTVIKIEEGAVTWLEATDMWFKVLRGAGYFIDFDDDEAIGILEELHREAKGKN
ncbi:MAG: hypothetical protein C0436_00270 [Alphaproteobacteria bacterium]|nr:hypothetical protein [Alphaproteobacteria bacterium]